MDMLAAGVYDLGLTAAEFSEFTPRHIDAMYKRHLTAECRRMLHTLWYMNVHRDREVKPDPFAMHDLVPIPAERNGHAQDVAIERQIAAFEAFTQKAAQHGVASPIKKWVPNG